jgi:DNA primase
MIPAQTVDLVMQTALIEEVVGDYVELKKSGSSFRGLSPFTNEKTPSFYVLPEKGISSVFLVEKEGAW